MSKTGTVKKQTKKKTGAVSSRTAVTTVAGGSCIHVEVVKQCCHIKVHIDIRLLDCGYQLGVWSNKVLLWFV